MRGNSSGYRRIRDDETFTDAELRGCPWGHELLIDVQRPPSSIFGAAILPEE